MKKKYVYAEFTIIFLFLVIPPLITGPNSQESIQIANGGHFSVTILVQLAISLALLVQNFKEPFNGKINNENKFSRTISFMKWWPICLGLTMLSQAALTGVSILFKINSRQIMIFPSSAVQWFIYFINLAIGVIYEETVYRLFLPDNMVNFISGKKNMWIPAEILCVLVFALSHRYLGGLAVVNAAVCGAILRFTKIKSKSIVSPAFAHLIYNILQSIMVYSFGKA